MTRMVPGARSGCARTSTRDQGQAEDDITASVTVPRQALVGLDEATSRQHSVKFVRNCENRLFQRPDDAIIRGYDHMAEREFAEPGNFFSNYEPLTREFAAKLVEDAIGFSQFTVHSQGLIEQVVADETKKFFVSTAFPRIVDGKPSKNTRYLQLRPDLRDPRLWRMAEMGQRSRADCRSRMRCTPRSRAFSPGAGTTRPRPVSVRSRATGRSTTWSCPSCSWSSSRP